MAQPSKRQHIIEVAGDMFIRGGFSNISMEAIAEAVPVSKPTLYNHFDDKKSLFVAVVANRCQDLYESIEETIKRYSDTEESLRALALHFLEVILSPESLSIHRIIMSESINFPELGILFYESGPQRIHLSISNYFKRLDESGALSIPHPELSASFFVGMLKGSCHMQCMIGIRPELSASEITLITETAVRVFMKGHAKLQEADK